METRAGSDDDGTASSGQSDGRSGARKSYQPPTLLKKSILSAVTADTVISVIPNDGVT